MEACGKAPLNSQHIEPGTRWAEDFTGLHYHQLRTGYLSYDEHETTKIEKRRLENLAGVMSLEVGTHCKNRECKKL